MKRVKPFQFKKIRTPILLNLPPRPSISANDDPEILTGEVNGMQASAPEERMARALDRAGVQYYFRWTVGAPRGLPGWKELDFIVVTKGMLYAVEVDTAFTHRSKENADVLHDAIVLNDQELNMMGQLFPHVIHVDGDSDLADEKNAKAYVSRRFNK